MEDQEKLYTVEEIADYLKVDNYTVQMWLRESKLKGFKLGNGAKARWRVSQSALNDFMGSE